MKAESILLVFNHLNLNFSKSETSQYFLVCCVRFIKKFMNLIMLYFVFEIVYGRISNWCLKYNWMRRPPTQFQFENPPESRKNLIPSIWFRGKSSKHVILKGSWKFHEIFMINDLICPDLTLTWVEFIKLLLGTIRDAVLSSSMRFKLIQSSSVTSKSSLLISLIMWRAIKAKYSSL